MPKPDSRAIFSVNKMRNIHQKLSGQRRITVIELGPTLIENELKIFDPMTTADQVARYLQEKGAKGKLADGCGCPLAKYLRQAAPDCSVAIDEHQAKYECVIWIETIDSESRYCIRLNKVLTDFVRSFDVGLYPFLVEDSPEQQMQLAIPM